MLLVTCYFSHLVSAVFMQELKYFVVNNAKQVQRKVN